LETRDQEKNTAGRLPELRRALVHTGRAFGLLWAAGRGRTAAWAAVSVLDALLPAAVAVVAKLIVDAVVEGSMGDALVWVGVEFGLVALRSVLYHLDAFFSAQLGARLGIQVNTLILEKALSLSLRHFEDSAFTDKLARAAKEAGSRPLHIVQHGFGFIKESVRLASYVVILWTFSGWAVLAVLGGTAPQFAVQAWAATRVFAVQMARTYDERRADYLKEVLTREAFAKEVKLFSLGRFLLRRYLGYQEEFYAQDQRIIRRTLAWEFAARLLATAAFYGCYVFVVMQAVREQITLGDMTMLMLAVRGAQESFEAMLNAAAKVYEGNLYMANLFSYLAIPEDEPWRDLDPLGTEGRRPPEVTFDGVGFGYPGTAGSALQDVSFSIQPGETLALVGPNGAGKTTLVKLLVRLYEPDSGAILVDGLPAAGFAPADLRRRIGVIFQDFVQFHLTAAENIGIGWIPAVEDREQIHEAAVAGDADSFIRELEHGYDTMLGRYYGGAQLSVGQWQRVALARAFMRHADVLILDEPTAALDAQAEAALFERFQQLKEGRTAVLITHRFSTVRFADRIVVLDAGRVVEQGTHAELLAAGGLYARMFKTQAKGYTLGEDWSSP